MLKSVELIKNRQLDATLQSAGLGVASLKDLATSLPIDGRGGARADVAAKAGRGLSSPRRSRPAPMTGQEADVPSGLGHQYPRHA
ncbi:hypothetical protein PE067_16660 [Paracoccus sp. DMF-8]|uniref:hypothetical protein n=1 Tax=Paracoccus sp. DMF-8 TaxID=3019445 RepID=UPI0023E44E13|nr:hypothetical protein [Paracoccus sp. DMF-8]MDF3607633.1 hypothetical protein [Paracoccus sp. DMF-8]